MNEDINTDVDQVLADAEATLGELEPRTADQELHELEDQLLAGSAKKRADAAPTEGIEVQVVSAVYEDEDAAPSRYVNPSRNKSIKVFEAKYGRSQPEDSMDINWLVWHSLGRPGRNGVRPVEPAIGAAEDRIFDEWYDSVEFLHNKVITRGKVS